MCFFYLQLSAASNLSFWEILHPQFHLAQHSSFSLTGGQDYGGEVKKGKKKSQPYDVVGSFFRTLLWPAVIDLGL